MTCNGNIVRSFAPVRVTMTCPDRRVPSVYIVLAMNTFSRTRLGRPFRVICRSVARTCTSMHFPAKRVRVYIHVYVCTADVTRLHGLYSSPGIRFDSKSYYSSPPIAATCPPTEASICFQNVYVRLRRTNKLPIVWRACEGRRRHRPCRPRRVTQLLAPDTCSTLVRTPFVTRIPYVRVRSANRV